MPIASKIFMLAALLCCAGSSTDETFRPILTSRLNNSSLTLNCSVNCTYTKIIWNIGNSRSNRNDIYNINGIQNFIQTNTTNRRCTMDNTTPQTFELIIDISIPNISSILPSITCVGVLGMDDDFVFSANTVNLAILLTEKTSVNQSETSWPILTLCFSQVSGRGEWVPNPADLLCEEGVLYKIASDMTLYNNCLHVQAPITNGSVHINTSCVSEKDGDSLSIAEITGVSTSITFLMATLLGFLAGLVVMHLCSRKKAVYSPAVEGQANIEHIAPASPVYEEVLPKEEIELNTNQAYGPVRV